MELRKCPFCGGTPLIRSVHFGMERFDRYGVVCQTCYVCVGWEETEEKAAERWNRRYDDGEKVGLQES